MLGEGRIEEAQANVRAYLKEGLLKRAGAIDRNILMVFRKNSEESLRIANLLLEGNLSWLWTVVCSYYAMYYAANAVLYKLGYKVGHKISHKVISDALIVLVKDRLRSSLLEGFDEARAEASELAGLKTDELLKSFDYERIKRSKFQYEMTEEVKRGKAETSLKRAKEFVFEMEKLLL